jgi:hypothetical protein
VVAASGGRVDLDVEVQAPPWVTAHDLVADENGRPLVLTSDGHDGYDATVGTAAGQAFATPLGSAGVVRLHARVTVHPSRDSFYVFVARGARIEPLGPGEAFGYTNPVYVDTDGNGWQPPLR